MKRSPYPFSATAVGLAVAAELGDSDVLEIGDWVIAVGNPFELEGTVSAGIISSKGRALGPNKRTNYLQTDAAINPGNSGGPLVNLDGQVVGINTAIASNNGSYQGVGFAIPSNMARNIMRQLIDDGEVRRGWLGVGIQDLDSETTEALDLESSDGVVVREVIEDTHEVVVDAVAEPGRYHLRVGLYGSDGRVPAHRDDGTRWPGDAVDLGTVEVR